MRRKGSVGGLRYASAMSEPYDDPQVRAAVEAAGLTYRPGMAAQLMTELAPLLTAEGIDLDNLDDIDPDTFNAALSRATERHNLELFTPIGKERVRSLTVLRQFCEALDGGYVDLAQAILGAAKPETTESMPAISHVIGVGLGLLDTWQSDPELFPALRRPQVSTWRAASRTAARTVLARSRVGRAFDSLESLVVGHGGLALFEGVALAVYACVNAVAASRGVGADVVIAELLGEGEGIDGRATPSAGRRSRATTHRSKSDKGVSVDAAKVDAVRTDAAASTAFAGWLFDQPEIAAPSVEAEIVVFDAVLRVARADGLDPHYPAGMLRLVDRISQIEDDAQGTSQDVLATLLDYARYRATARVGAAGWDEVLEAVQVVLDAHDPLSQLLDRVMVAAAQVDPAVRRAAFAQTRVVSAVPDLLRWLGSGRAVAASGWVRRADIAAAAGFLGVKAVGVSKRPPYALVEDEPPEDRTYYAKSAGEVAPLAAWWMALRAAEVIDVGVTRVWPGAAAAAWLAGTGPALDDAERLIGVFIAGLLTHDLRPWVGAERAAGLMVARLLRAIVPEEGVVTMEEDESDRDLDWYLRRRLADLVHAGVVESCDDGRPVVAPALRGAVARGLLLTVMVLNNPEPGGAEDAWEED